MATNKTRVFIAEPVASKGPYQAVTEFEIYQEAIDYAKAAVVSMYTVDGTADIISAFVYSYDNPSYRFRYTSSEFHQIEFEFPDTQSWIQS